MLNEKFVEAMRDLAREGAKAQVLHKDSRMLHYLRPDGGAEIAVVAPADRQHTVRTVNDLVAAAEKYGKGPNVELGLGSLWHDDSGCVLLCEDCDRRDRVGLPLQKSPQWLTLAAIADQTIPHAQFMSMLRNDLRGVIPQSFATTVSAIEVNSKTRRQSEATVGRERGTAEFDRELQNAQSVPETVIATMPVYSTPDLLTHRQQIALVFEIDLDTCHCRLTAIPGEMDAAIHATQAEIADRLRDADLPVFYGCP